MDIMEQHPFIFSNKLKYRLSRHLLFWLLWWAFCSFLYSYVPIGEDFPRYIRLLISSAEALVFLSVHMFVAYSMVYLLVPYFLIKGRYGYSFVAVAFLFLITGILNAFLSPHVGELRNFILNPFLQDPLPKRFEQTSFHYSMLAGLRGGITVGGLAAAIKLMKYWYIKDRSAIAAIKSTNSSAFFVQYHEQYLFLYPKYIASSSQTGNGSFRFASLYSLYR
jgi:hypothetical protein